MKPAIGRIVIYHNGVVDYPAIITRVWNDNCVNLQIFEDGIGILIRTSVVEGIGVAQWSWPVIEAKNIGTEYIGGLKS